MKLYAKSYANTGGRMASKGSNDVLIVELYNGNYYQGMLTMNVHNNELVYNKFENNAFIPVYREKLRDKTQN